MTALEFTLKYRLPLVGFSLTIAVVASLASLASETSVASATEDPVIAAAGDIACAPGVAKSKSKCHHGNTAQLLQDGNYTAVLPLGDEQYECGNLGAFLTEYDPTWGQFNDKAYPIVGDNEYAGGSCSTPGASGYFTYFGNRASPDQDGCLQACRGYYSYDIGTWHMIALNSECTQPGVGGCSATSPMGTWLEKDLAAHPTSCTLAYMHRPYWANGGVSTKFKPLMQLMYDAGVEILLSGHNHFYSRFAPQSPASVADPNGIRQFVVGTGGVSHSSTPVAMPNLEEQDTTTFGLLSLTLHPDSYDFEFVPDTTSGLFTDLGGGDCHGAAPSGDTPGQVTAAKVVSGSTTDRAVSVTVRYAAASGAPTGYRIEVIDQTTGD
ncbi:MAG TPA: hypothetical protein VES21_12355, partial [Nocardioidaceae bacterium]|nr:hypothetical protein [Nocardioidaceae bacterium]